MSTTLQEMMETLRRLPAEERAWLAHCLIASLETGEDEAVEAAWAELAERRLREIESGAVQTMSWQQVKRHIRPGDA